MPLTPPPFKGAGRLASSGMGIEGFGKSKADGLKVMESKAILYLGPFFPEANLHMIEYGCTCVHVHTQAWCLYN